MRRAAGCLALVMVVACGARPKTPPPTRSAAALPHEFLVDAAATDFRTHPPNPATFREVRFGHIAHEGDKQYLLCGQFQPSGSTEWKWFKTIKTSSYEQYIGGEDLCTTGSITWEDRGDLSAALQRRYESTK